MLNKRGSVYPNFVPKNWIYKQAKTNSQFRKEWREKSRKETDDRSVLPAAINYGHTMWNIIKAFLLVLHFYVKYCTIRLKEALAHFTDKSGEGNLSFHYRFGKQVNESKFSFTS